MNPEFDLALMAAKITYAACRKHVNECSTCYPWFGSIRSTCDVGGKLAYLMYDAEAKLEQALDTEIADGNPIIWHKEPKKDSKSGWGVRDGTLPVGAPGYWAEGYPERLKERVQHE